MKSLKSILSEAKLKSLDDKREGRPEIFYITFDNSQGTNIYLEKEGKGLFAPIEKVKDDDFQKYAFKGEKAAVQKKLKALEDKFDKDLDLTSEFDLSRWTS
jgi:hypothetical protein